MARWKARHEESVRPRSKCAGVLWPVTDKPHGRSVTIWYLLNYCIPEHRGLLKHLNKQTPIRSSTTQMPLVWNIRFKLKNSNFQNLQLKIEARRATLVSLSFFISFQDAVAKLLTARTRPCCRCCIVVTEARPRSVRFLSLNATPCLICVFPEREWPSLPCLVLSGLRMSRGVKLDSTMRALQGAIL